jgi:hypothetical protein
MWSGGVVVVTIPNPQRHRRHGLQDIVDDTVTMSSPSVTSILVNVDIETYPLIPYPTIQAFLDDLHDREPLQWWPEVFLKPLTTLGVRTLDDIAIVSPESIFVFYKINPIAIMDFYVHVTKTIDVLHHTYGASIAPELSGVS